MPATEREVPVQHDGEAFRLRQRGLGPAARRHGFGDGLGSRAALLGFECWGATRRSR